MAEKKDDKKDVKKESNAEKKASSLTSVNEKKASSLTSVNEKTADNLIEDAHREERKKKQNKQIMWAVILMVAVIVIILIFPVLSNAIFNRFEYNGIVFHKTRLGTIDFYSTRVPLTNAAPVNGSLIDKSMITGSFPLDLREDPRELKDVSVDIDSKNITFLRQRSVYISLNASDPPCQHNVIAAVELTGFLVSFGKINAQGAVVNEDYAKENKIPYVTCENKPDNTVILVVNGNENKISKLTKNCYEIQYKECDVLPVTERFIIEILNGYMSYFEK